MNLQGILREKTPAILLGFDHEQLTFCFQGRAFHFTPTSTEKL